MQVARYLVKFISSQVRYMATKSNNHYNSLGISPKSTQSEIKSAYYRLSMVYHPDKAKDEVSIKKFRDITEAYEVLGNVKTRRLYDKGLYFRTGSEPHSDAKDQLHKWKETRAKTRPESGPAPVYDFDEWAKSHYGATFRKQMKTRRDAENYRNSRAQEINDQKLEKVLFAVTAIILICMISGSSKDYDTHSYGSFGTFVRKKSSNDDPKQDK